MRTGRWMILLGTALAPACAQATVKSATDAGFAVESSVDIAADADRVYALLSAPDRWWNGAHSYSGDAANLRFDPKAGGCFCETLPSAKGSAGSVEHARVIYAEPGRQLRLSGALGPLQAEAVTGTLNFDISKMSAGVRVTLTYVVGGYMRMGAPPLRRLSIKFSQSSLRVLSGLRRSAAAGIDSGRAPEAPSGLPTPYR